MTTSAPSPAASARASRTFAALPATSPTVGLSCARAMRRVFRAVMGRGLARPPEAGNGAARSSAMSSLSMEPPAATHVVPPTNWRFHHDEGWSSLADRHSAADHPDPVLPRLPALRTDVAPLMARGAKRTARRAVLFYFGPRPI